MLCQICGQNEATIRYTEMVNDRYTQYHICGDCAAKHNIKLPSPFAELDLGGGMTGLLGFKAPKTTRTACPLCGSTFDAIARNGKAGCPECYQTFRGELSPSIRQIHGAMGHTGKIPPSAGERVSLRRKLDALRRELDAAVKSQEYEKAAGLRDRIKELTVKEG